MVETVTSISRLRVFVADDEPLAVERLVSLLAEDAQVEVVGQALQGAAALDAIAQLQPDVAILDIRMPRLSGMSVARALLNSPKTQVVFATAYPQFALEAFEVNAAAKRRVKDRLAAVMTAFSGFRAKTASNA